MIAGDAARSQDEPFVRLAVGPWARAEVRQTLGPAPDLTADATAIAARWSVAVAAARRDGRSLFPGPVLGLSSWSDAASRRPEHTDRSADGSLRELPPRSLVKASAALASLGASAHPASPASGGGVALRLHATDYRAFVGTNLSPEHVASGRACADPVGLSLVVLAPGPCVLLHRRGAACFEHPLFVDTPGGHAEPGKHLAPDGSPCVFVAARDELLSELGLGPGDLAGDLSLLGLTRIRATAKPQLVLLARTRLDPGAVRERIAHASEGYETAELLPCDRRALEALVAAARSGGERVTPAGLAAITLLLEGGALG